MDKLDHKLLNELQSQGFQRSAFLAPRLGLGERTIRHRIRNMKNKGIIKIIAVPNPVLFGYKAWAKIGIKVEHTYLADVAHKLVEHPSIYFVASSLGIFDLMIAVHFQTMDGLSYFVNSELTLIKGILSTETILLMCPRKYYNFSWPEPIFNKVNEVEFRPDATSYGIYEMDDTDRRIVNLLKQDALAPSRVLKSKLGLGEGTIRKRIKKMLREEVFKIEVVPNPKSLEYEVWATIGLVVNNQFTHNVVNAVIKNSAVYLASVCLGRFNVILSAHFDNVDSLNAFIKAKLVKIKGVSTAETFIHTKPLKYHSIIW
jgi:Lrp/AsnC family transcriptional regulator for asnA, asnC and gidA